MDLLEIRRNNSKLTHKGATLMVQTNGLLKLIKKKLLFSLFLVSFLPASLAGRILAELVDSFLARI